jgi:asparagine synthase (glutamine-hydrolysing)
MQAQSSRPVKTFSIGFHEEQYNEAHHAKAVAEHLGTEHTELYVTAEDALNVIPKLANIYDEPFADASQIPTYLVAKMARAHVTVSLSGDAGDELFCGYNRYLMTAKLWGFLSKLPLWLRRVMSGCIKSISPDTWSGLARVLLPSKFTKASLPFGDRLFKGANVICAESISDLYSRLASIISEPQRFVLSAAEPKTSFLDDSVLGCTDNNVEKMMAIDMLGYLPNDILTKVDRAAMGVSLETRVPLLDHRVVEFAWQLPINYKLYEGVGKWILREVLYKYVPKKLIERPKMGFAIPIDQWLRGPLREWAEKLIHQQRLDAEGFLNSIEVQKLWKEHISGHRNWQYPLWNILMFQLWLEKNVDEA